MRPMVNIELYCAKCGEKLTDEIPVREYDNRAALHNAVNDFVCGTDWKWYEETYDPLTKTVSVGGLCLDCQNDILETSYELIQKGRM